jgi:hypothetical protein
MINAANPIGGARGAPRIVSPQKPTSPMSGRHLMRNLKVPIGFFVAIAFVLCASGPLLADGTPNQSSAQSMRNATPVTRVAACLPDGAACNSGGDCCTGNCAPQHHKCGR